MQNLQLNVTEKNFPFLSLMDGLTTLDTNEK